MKGLATTQLKELIEGIKNGSIPMRGNEPKMSLRALRSLLLSEDKVHADLVEDLLSGKLNIEQFKNKIRKNIEKTQPNKVKILATDRIHHKTPLQFGNILENMPDEELRIFLTDAYESRGLTYGDTDQNIRGSSFDERAHTGARPKKSKSKTIYPALEGPDGNRLNSAHPRGVRDTIYDLSDRPITAADAKKLALPLEKTADLDFQKGVAADTSRRNFVNSELRKAGVLDNGVDIFSATTTDEQITKARKVLNSSKLQKGAAKAFGLPFVGGLIAGATVLAQTGDAKAAVGAAVDAENPINNVDGGKLFDESQDYQTVLNQAKASRKRPIKDALKSFASNESRYIGKSLMSGQLPYKGSQFFHMLGIL